MKTTLKEIRRYVTTNAAEDLTKKRFADGQPSGTWAA